MIFLLFLVSLGTVHLILAAEEKHKKNSSRPATNHEAAGDLVSLAAGDSQATSQDVFSLLKAIEQHGRGEQPGAVPTVPAIPAESGKS